MAKIIKNLYLINTENKELLVNCDFIKTFFSRVQSEMNDLKQKRLAVSNNILFAIVQHWGEQMITFWRGITASSYN